MWVLTSALAHYAHKSKHNPTTRQYVHYGAANAHKCSHTSNMINEQGWGEANQCKIPYVQETKK